LAGSPIALEDTKEVLLFLATAGVVVPLFRRLKVSPVIGFLGAGVLLGPHGLGGFSNHPWLDFFQLENTQRIAKIAEFGVVFLLFMIGLELSYERLTRLRRLVFGLGAAQVLLSTLVLGELAALIFGLPQGAALVVGGALALSSTAIVIPVLAERRRLSTTAGRAAFAVLLFQDLMVAPLLFAVSMAGDRGGGTGADMLYAILPAMAALAVLVLGGRLLLRPLFHQVALARSTEFFMATCLFVVIGTGVASAMSGLSMALGAFIAGLLLGETEYRREIEVTLEPFKGLLLGLFFVSIGVELDLTQIARSPGLVVGIALGLIVLKAAILFGLARVAGLPAPAAGETALLLGPGGEFAFVMITAAVAERLLPASTGATLILAVTLSMATIPLLALLGARRRPVDPQALDPELAATPPQEQRKGRVIVVGYGRVGRLVGEMLARHKLDFIAVDGDPKLVARERPQARNLYWGDATRPEFLRACGLEEASALIVTIDRPQQAEQVVALARKARPDITIVARARDAHHATQLYALGATDAIPETTEASLQLSEAALVDIGVPMGLVIASIHEKRDEYRKLLQPDGEEHERRAFRPSTRMKDMGRRRDPRDAAQEPG
jgi:CPA2 family monovalent cation:H+ antiporter-2